ncbi:MAG: NAD(+) kinase [Ruminococcaceae bacterium]|nr:NAD(+) kinase [Oscillospiraceae bacterium]
MTAKVENVILLPNTSKKIDPVLVQSLVQRISAAGCRILCGEESRAFLEPLTDSVRFCMENELFANGDMIFVLGGDGSIIEAARRCRCSGRNIPIAGINCGRLGYMAEIEINELELVDQILAGKGEIEERIMLDATIIRGDTVLRAEIPALNEVVLTNGPVPKLLSFELYCDGELAENCYADGMILSTPTGSTAYSLSAGGPVVDPRMDCICATPICPQTMNNRPVLFDGASVLEWRNMITRSKDTKVYLSIDSRESYVLEEGDAVRITHSSCRTSLIRIKKGGFLSALRRKLT